MEEDRRVNLRRVSATFLRRSSLADMLVTGWVAMSKRRKFCFSVRRIPCSR